ncbi:MAG: Trp family transcriptional regulator [Gammaproteobacteria bacterium]|nr:Trp family transcriptional regulator [Gammaproteobacteria bacterium]|tara:strand:+ start:268 stop:444 length:177 start_codon:yes stop_codon:yes gene_type:complete
MTDNTNFKRNTGSKEFQSTQDQLRIIDLLNEGYTFREVKSMTGFSHSSIGLIAKSNFK